MYAIRSYYENDNGSNIQAWSRNDGSGQLWKVVAEGDHFRFENLTGGKALDVSGGKVNEKGARNNFV